MSSALQSQTARLTYRLLPPEELPRLNSYEPFKSHGGLPAEVTQGYAQAVVAELDGEIAAFWFIFQAVHVEPLWVAPAFRNRNVVGRLWETVVKVLREASSPIAYAIIDDDADHLSAALRLGFQRLGTIYGISPWNPTKGDKEKV